jgi:hypothetical protein
MKYIYAVEYDKVPGVCATVKILGEPCEDEFNSVPRLINAISEQIINGQRTVLICYTDGSDEEVFNISNIHRRSK